jgi:hypothetical protein
MKKLFSLFAKALDAFYYFRLQYLFLLPSEASRLMAAHEAKTKQELGARREQFKEALLQLTELRTKVIRNTYEIKLFVNKASLETVAGENVAVMDISLAIAKQILERHSKSKQNKANESKV